MVARFDKDKHLRRRDFLFNFLLGVLCYTSAGAKSFNPVGELLIYRCQKIKDNKLCPAQAIFICLQLSQGASLDEPALVYKLNGRLKSLTCEVFISRVRDCLALCDINPLEIASHSILRCGATFCYSVGLRADAIKLLGDWLSSCYRE